MCLADKTEVNYAYEFGLLFYLRMVAKHDPFSSRNKDGYLLYNPLNKNGIHVL